jgi:hypothetical protein
LSLNIFTTPLFFNITLWGFAIISFVFFLEHYPSWASTLSFSSYMINIQLDILKIPKSIWFNNDWCLATCDYPWLWLVYKC